MLRTILLIIGIIVVLAIAFDGWRRKRQRRMAIMRGRTALSATKPVVPAEHEPDLLVPPAPPIFKSATPESAPVRDDASVVTTQIRSANESLPKRETVKKKAITAPPMHSSSIIMLTVMSANNQPFIGYDLIKALDEANLHFGDYDIYHRHKYKNGKGPLYFSVASVTKPGTIDPQSVAAISTPGIALFMRRDNPKHDRITFKQMLSTAHELARALGGVVCDDQRIPLRETTLKHYSEKLNL